MHPRKDDLPYRHARTLFASKGQAVQRAVLLGVMCLLAAYTFYQSLQTNRILTKCATTVSVGETKTSSPTPPPAPDIHRVDPSFDPIQNLEEMADPFEQGHEYDHEHAQYYQPPAKSAAIGKVTMLYGPWADDKNNQLVLKNHQRHADKHGYSMHVLDRQTIHGMWSKLSYMLMLVLEEIAKPGELRMKWLFWFDIDIVVMNAKIPLEIFLPPEDKFEDIKLVVTNDHNGLNTGAFFLKVDEWAVKYLADVIALHTFKPEVKLRFSDQSAMEYMMKQKKYAKNCLLVPQRWFNSYLGPRNETGKLKEGEEVPENTMKEGDMQLHFAGKKVKNFLPVYLEAAMDDRWGWEISLEETRVKEEIGTFWEQTMAKQANLKKFH